MQSDDYSQAGEPAGPFLYFPPGEGQSPSLSRLAYVGEHAVRRLSRVRLQPHHPAGDVGAVLGQQLTSFGPPVTVGTGFT